MYNIDSEVSNNILNDGVSKLIHENIDSLSSIIDSLVNKYTNIWYEVCRKPIVKASVETSEETDFWSKRKRQVYTDKFIDCFAKKIRDYPADLSKRIEWKNEINALKEDFISKIGFIKMGDMKFLFSSGIIEATKDFVEEARAFDKDARMEDIGQAVRNVWIMNITQLLLNMPVKCTPSVFSYSMLYPYTDNCIDNAQLDPNCKRSYNSHFEKRLSGEYMMPKDDYEMKIISLVEFIEKEYERSSFPYVYESLIGIHNAQNKSMHQHCLSTTPYDSDIVGISLEKGGTSVLADAFLVKGRLSAIQINFFFAYGLMLQLCDDLQDVKEDLKNNHHTIYSLTALSWPLDNITNGLFNLVDYVTELIDNLEVDNPSLFKNIIKRNCYLLIYFAISKNAKFYTRSYISGVKANLPYNLTYMKRLNKKISRKYSKLKPTYNSKSTEDILLDAIM